MTIEPFSLWLMGPTSAGKTTIAKALVNKLKEGGHHTLHVDGDDVRELFGNSLGFSEEERLRVVSACLFMVNKAREAKISSVTSALTAGHTARRLLYEQIPKILVGYIHCPIKVCAQRDPKGLYAKAKRGEIDTLIGYSSEYKVPEQIDFTIDTSTSPVDECVQRIIDFLKKDCEHP